MKVVLVAVESDFDIVAPSLIGLVVKRLSQVTDKVDDELESLCNILAGETAISYTAGVICDGRN